MSGRWELTPSHSHVAATAVPNSDYFGSRPMAFFLLFVGGAVLGTLLLAAAVRRCSLLPRTMSVLIIARAVLDFAVGTGVASHIVNLIGLSIAAAAVVTGYRRGDGPTSWLSRSAWW